MSRDQVRQCRAPRIREGCFRRLYAFHIALARTGPHFRRTGGVRLQPRIPAGTDPVPAEGGVFSVDREAERLTEREWALLARNGQLGSPPGVMVRDSWHRSQMAGVPLELARAPVALAGDGLAGAVE